MNTRKPKGREIPVNCCYYCTHWHQKTLDWGECDLPEVQRITYAFAACQVRRKHGE